MKTFAEVEVEHKESRTTVHHDCARAQFIALLFARTRELSCCFVFSRIPDGCINSGAFIRRGEASPRA